MNNSPDLGMIREPQSSRLVNTSPSSRQYATEVDWHKNKNTIIGLYQNQTLKEVMKIMERDYGHHATPKMYKDRIKKWRVDKNMKENEAWAILRLNLRRELSAKDSAFCVRGKPVTVDDILRYFKRKGIHHSDPGAPTPPSVECWTPCNTPEVDSTPIESEEIAKSFPSGGVELGNLLPVTPNQSTSNIENNIFELLDFDQAQKLLFCTLDVQSYEVPKVLLPPPKLLAMEKLLTCITNYYHTAFLNGSFETRGDGYLTLTGDIRQNDTRAPLQFNNLCHTGVNMMNSGKFVEGRRCFSKASSLVRDVLGSQHPDSIPRILSVFLDLKKKGRAEITTLFVDFMGDMTRTVFASGHPWIQIIYLISRVDEPEYTFTLLRAWRCIFDAFVVFLGPFHATVLDLNLEFLIITSPNPLRLIQTLLSLAEQQLHEHDERLLKLRYQLGLAFYTETRYVEALEVLEALHGGLEVHSLMRARTMAMISICEMKLGQYINAELMLRKSVAMFEGVCGRSNAITLHYKGVLLSWLSEWGREGEANSLETEISEAIGPS